MPSKEAMDAAEKLIRVWTPADDVPHISIFEVTAPAWTNERAEGWRQSLIQEIAAALDDHTATLRAERKDLERMYRHQEATEIVAFLRNAVNNVVPDGANDRFIAGLNYAIGLIKPLDDL